MTSPTLLIQQWPTTELVVEDLQAAAIQPSSWHHFASSCATPKQEGAPREGTTLWVSAESPVRAAIAWSWVELTQGVLVLENPNALVANFQLSGRQKGLDSLCAERRKLLLLNTIVNRLNWQARVLAALLATSQVARTEAKSSN